MRKIRASSVRKRSDGFWGAGMLLLSMFGCAIFPQPADVPLRTTTAKELLQKLEKKESAIHSLKALFRAHVQGRSIPVAYRLDGVFLYQRPDTIRLKAFNRFGGIVFDFLLRNEHYVLNVPGEKQVFSGMVNDASTPKSLGIPVRLSLRALEVVLGKVKESPDDHIHFVEEGNRYRLDVSHDGIPIDSSLDSSYTRRVWVDRRYLQVNEVEHLNFYGIPIFTVQAEDFRRVKDASPVENATIMLPFTIETEDMVEEGKVSLDFQEVVVNAQLRSQEFGLDHF